MATTPLTELIDDRTHLHPLNVEQYHDMMASGLLQEGEPYELLEGVVVGKDRSARGDDPMTVGNEHAWAVRKLARVGRQFDRGGCFLQTQQPITLPPRHEPEPDAAIIVGTEDDFLDRHPGADDVLCVIEVADASLKRDRNAKARIYANSGIPQYVIINLPDRTIEVYTQPLRGKGRYGRSETLVPGQRVSLPVRGGKVISVPVRSLLP